jgi:hypothetical protein
MHLPGHVGRLRNQGSRGHQEEAEIAVGPVERVVPYRTIRPLNPGGRCTTEVEAVRTDRDPQIVAGFGEVNSWQEDERLIGSGRGFDRVRQCAGVT